MIDAYPLDYSSPMVMKIDPESTPFFQDLQDLYLFIEYMNLDLDNHFHSDFQFHQLQLTAKLYDKKNKKYHNTLITVKFSGIFHLYTDLSPLNTYWGRLSFKDRKRMNWKFYGWFDRGAPIANVSYFKNPMTEKQSYRSHPVYWYSSDHHLNVSTNLIFSILTKIINPINRDRKRRALLVTQANTSN
jgi:hypothetical protein